MMKLQCYAQVDSAGIKPEDMTYEVHVTLDPSDPGFDGQRKVRLFCTSTKGTQFIVDVDKNDLRIMGAAIEEAEMISTIKRGLVQI